MTKQTKQVLLAELVLILASVFVFRGFWMLLDLFPAMHSPLALWLSLVLGTAASLWALHALLRDQKEK